jgi:hypothetical protein
MPEQNYRKTVAIHFHQLTQISRHDIFGDTDLVRRPINLPEDNSTMFAGYVGHDYKPGLGLLFLAINPGGGGDAYTRRIPEDDIFYPLLQNFKAASARSAVEAFESINSAFVPIVKGWNLWRILGPTLDAAGACIDEVAYMNVVPYRTRGDKMPPVAIRRTAWSQIVEPTLALLEPRAIITLGKKAGSVVDALMKDELPTYCVPRTIGDSYISEDAERVHRQLRKEIGINNRDADNGDLVTDAPVSPNIVTIPKTQTCANVLMNTINIIQQPKKPFRPGSERSRAWCILQAFDGFSVEAFVNACSLMERASGAGGDPSGWVKFFTATGRYENRPGNSNASERLAEVYE